MPKLWINMDEELKLTEEMVDVMDLPNRNVCVSPLWYEVDKSETWYAQVRLFAKKKKEEENFQQIVWVISKYD